MTFSALKNFIYQSLNSLYDPAEIQAFYFLLLTHYGKYTKTELLAAPDTMVAANSLVLIKKAVEALKEYVPIQYILGETEFYSHKFIVNKAVLIPRPETEELVDWVLNELKTEKHPLSIADIGTGSGCIAISLAKALPQASVTAIDISGEALAVARANAANNGVTIRWQQQDILATPSLTEQYDVIVSNPPYVRESEKAQMSANVLNYEPHTALFVGDEQPLVFYEQIASLARTALKENGRLFFEINQYLGEPMKAMLLQKGFSEVELRKDLSGNDRMILAKR